MNLVSLLLSQYGASQEKEMDKQEWQGQPRVLFHTCPSPQVYGSALFLEVLSGRFDVQMLAWHIQLHP